MYYTGSIPSNSMVFERERDLFARADAKYSGEGSEQGDPRNLSELTKDDDRESKPKPPTITMIGTYNTDTSFAALIISPF
jgi:hypothetical protein